MRFLLVSLALFVCQLSAQTIDKTLTATANDRIWLKNQRGEIRVEGWENDLVKISGTLDADTKNYTFERTATGIEFNLELPRNVSGDNSQGSKLVVFVPLKSHITVKAVSAHISAKNLQNGASLNTVSGNITGEQLAGRLTYNSVSGSIKTRDNAGSIQIETVNGEINDSGSTGDLSIASVNGDLTIDSAAQRVEMETVKGEQTATFSNLKQLEATTVAGDMALTLTQFFSNSEVQLESVSGAISLYLPADISAEFEINAHAGGKILNNYSTHKVNKAKYGPSRSLEFLLGQGEGEIEIDTISGRIMISPKNQ